MLPLFNKATYASYITDLICTAGCACMSGSYRALLASQDFNYRNPSSNLRMHFEELNQRCGLDLKYIIIELGEDPGTINGV